jgi:hypothetical protein
MVRTANVDVRVAWERRLQRFDQWTGTVKQFCAKEGVSAASLYQWRRKLDRNAPPGNSSGRRGRQRKASNVPQTGPSFVPVQVVGSAVVEVFLVEGARLSIPVDATDAISTVVRALSTEDIAASEDSGGRVC